MDIKERVKSVADKFEDKLRKEASELLKDRTPDLKAKDVTEPVEKVLEKETVEPITEPMAETTQDLKVKGSSIPLKQGTVIRNIRLVDGDAEHIEGHSDKIKGLVLKTCFLRKA